MNNKRKRVVIAGGGTAGWMAAAALSHQLGHHLDITLVESDQIGTVGVGESSIPTLQVFHRLLGIDEQEFMRETQATFKLGIRFEGWKDLGQNYIHSFGRTGKEFWAGGFQHFWLRGRQLGIAEDFGEYCFELKAAQANKFALLDRPRPSYAYHLNATRYARYLRKRSEHKVRRVEGKIEHVALSPATGQISHLVLESGAQVPGDFFVDCTGFRGLLIEEALETGYEDWSHWLRCDRALAVQTAATGPAVPYTRSSARESGWQWRIPLQSRVGNGLVYASDFMSDDKAADLLLANLNGKPLNEPRVIPFKTGKRRKAWNKNCLALGLASGFLEPLESTSIHLIMSGLFRLIKLFPFDDLTAAAAREYNQQADLELERIRDFIVLHYHVTERRDSPFWQACREGAIPDSLTHRLDLFRRTGQVLKAEDELFRVDSWTQVMLGQGLQPESYHAIADVMTDQELGRFLTGLQSSIAKAVAQLPPHHRFVEQYCKATAD